MTCGYYEVYRHVRTTSGSWPSTSTKSSNSAFQYMMWVHKLNTHTIIIERFDVTRTKLIKKGRHFGVQHRFLEKLACLSIEPRSYIDVLGAELVGKEDEWTN